MRRDGCLLVLVLLGLAFGPTVAPRRADGCSGFPGTALVLRQMFPASGSSDVATDTAVVVNVDGMLATGLPDLRNLEVRVVDGTSGRDVAGTLRWFGEGPNSGSGYWPRAAVVWRPQVALSPETQYTVSAIAKDPGVIAGPRMVEGAFTTGRGLLPALSASGAVQVTVEPFVPGPPQYCPTLGAGACPGPCPQGEGGLAWRVRVTVPAVNGGMAAAGYLAHVSITDRSDSKAQVASGAPATIIVDEPAGKTQVCVASVIEDATGRMLTLQPVCVAPPRSSSAQPDAGANVDAPAAVNAPGPADKGGGCSFTGRGTQPGALLGLVAAVALAVRRRR